MVNTMHGAGVLFAANLGGPNFERSFVTLSRNVGLPLADTFVPLIAGEELRDGFETPEQYHAIVDAAGPVLAELQDSLIGAKLEVCPDSLIANQPFINFKIRPAGLLKTARQQLLEATEGLTGINPLSDNPNGWWAYAGLTGEIDDGPIPRVLPKIVRVSGLVANPYVVEEYDSYAFESQCA